MGGKKEKKLGINLGRRGQNISSSVARVYDRGDNATRVAIISWFCPCAFIVNFSNHLCSHLKTDTAAHSLEPFHLFQFARLRQCHQCPSNWRSLRPNLPTYQSTWLHFKDSSAPSLISQTCMTQLVITKLNECVKNQAHSTSLWLIFLSAFLCVALPAIRSLYTHTHSHTPPKQQASLNLATQPSKYRPISQRVHAAPQTQLKYLINIGANKQGCTILFLPLRQKSA